MGKQKVSFYIDSEDLEQVKRLADRIEDNKAVGTMLRKLVKMGLDDALVLEKLGVVDVVLSAGKVINTLKQKFLSKTEDISLKDFKNK